MSVVEIFIDGTDYAPDILYKDAHFESQVNGVAGSCKFRVRDLGSTQTFVPGMTLLLKIDGENAWNGFIGSVNRVYIFPAYDTIEFGPDRFFDIIGVDINVLLTKRIVFNQANGAHILAPLLPAGTPDTTAITQLFDDWLDLSGDGIDTTSGVTGVGDTTAFQPGRAWEGSDTWAQAMQSIASIPAAVFYIDPDKVFIYTDVETENAPYPLSDQSSGGPSGPTTLIDTFNRIVAPNMTGDLGTGEIGTWVGTSTSPATTTYEVNGSEAIITDSDGFVGAFPYVPIPVGANGADSWSCSVTFRWGDLGIGTFNDSFELDFSDVPYDNDMYVFASRRDSLLEVGWYTSGGSDFIDIPDMVFPDDGAIGHIALFYDRVNNTLSGRYWTDGDAPPDYTVLTGVDAMPSDGIITVFYFYGSFSPSPASMTVSTVSFTYPGEETADTIGYSQMEVLFDGSGLANDVMCWGVGYGSQTPVFKRIQDAASIAEHGVWQLGQTTFGVYKQGTINRIASSIVYGSPESLRGAKDDRLAIQCVTFVPGFRVAQKVQFISTVFDFETTLPIRKMDIDFAAPDSPKYTLTLSHEIDTPFSFFDNFWWGTRFPALPPFPPFDPGGGGPIRFPPVCSDTVCLVPELIDDYARVVAVGWGTSTAGYVWSHSSGDSDVDGQVGRLLLSGGSTETMSITDGSGPWKSETYSISFSFSFTDEPDASNTTDLQMTDVLLQMAFADGPPITGSPKSYIAAGSGQATFIPHTFWDDTATYTLSKEVSNDQVLATVTKGLVSYSATGYAGFARPNTFSIFGELQGAGAQTISIDDLRITSNRCDEIQFDNFRRTQTHSWGAATPGGESWTLDENTFGSSSVTGNVVNGGGGTLEYHFNGTQHIGGSVQTDGGPWGDNVSWTMTMKFGFWGDQIGDFPIAMFVTGDTLGWQIGSQGIVNGGFANGSAPFLFVLGETYVFKWFYGNGFSQAKVWNILDAEPVAWMVVAVTENDPLDPTTVLFIGSQSDNNVAGDYNTQVYSIDFSYGERPCYVGGPEPVVPPGNMGAWISFLGDGVQITFDLGTSFVQNTPRVSVDNVLVPSTDYTQDANTGTITLNTPPAPGVSVQVNFWAVSGTVIVGSGALQDAIDATTTGGTLDITGQVFDQSASAVVNRAMTVMGGTVRTATGVNSIVVAASNVTLQDMTILGGRTTPVYATNECGIFSDGSYTNLSVSGCVIRGFGFDGIFIDGLDSVDITDNTVTDCGYGGIFGYSSTNVNVTGNTVQRIQPGATGNGNAYGIVMSQQDGPASENWLVDNNLVEDVPTWHGLDTHGGQNITFSNNTIRRCPRPIFITCGGINHEHCAGDITITDNTFATPLPANPLGFPNATNVNQAFVVGCSTITFTNNTTDSDFDPINNGTVGADTYHNYLRDFESGSTGITSTGNTEV